MSVYHFGVAACLEQFTDLSETHFYGASAGALVGANLLAGLSSFSSADAMINQCNTITSDSATIGPIAEQTINELCPDDAHTRCSNRLHVSCSKWDLTQLVPAYFSSYDTNEQFKDTLLASAHLPFISGLMPRTIHGYEGQYLDGVMTDPHPDPRRVARSKTEEPTPCSTPTQQHSLTPPRSSTGKQNSNNTSNGNSSNDDDAQKQSKDFSASLLARLKEIAKLVEARKRCEAGAPAKIDVLHTR